MNYINQYRGLPKQVYVICFSRMILGISSMSFTISTLLLRSILGIPEFLIGLIVSGQAILAVAASMLGGRLADFYGRKRISLLMFILVVISCFASSVLCRSRWVIPFLFTTNFFSSAAYPGIAGLLADAMRGTGRREGFALLYLCQNLGIAIGPAIGGALFYNHLPWVYRCQAIVICIAMLFFGIFTVDNYDPSIARASRKIAVQARKNGTNDAESGVSIFKVLQERPILMCYFGSLIVITICYQMVSFVLNLQMNDSFGLEVASKFSGRVWSVNGFTILFFSPIVSAKFKHMHQFKKMVFATILYAIGFGSYAYLRHPIMALTSAFIWTLGEILISTDSGGFIADNSPVSHVARCQSLYQTSRSVGRSLSSPLFGWLLGYISYKQAWHINTVLCLAMSVFMYFSYRKYGMGTAKEHIEVQDE